MTAARFKACLRPWKRRWEEWYLRRQARPQLAGRYQLPSLLNARGLTRTGVEVGVFEGWFSNYLLTYWRGERLISVDPWRAWGGDYQDACNRGQAEMDRLYEASCRLLAGHGRRSEIWRLTSAEAAERVPAAALDFVYIDAQHQESAVARDLRLWHPKVRAGGLLAGHDYMDGTFPFGVFGVKSAVDGFAREHGLEGLVTGEAQSPSWLLFKP